MSGSAAAPSLFSAFYILLILILDRDLLLFSLVKPDEWRGGAWEHWVPPPNNIVARVILSQPKSCLSGGEGSLSGSFVLFYAFRSLFMFLDN